MTQFSIDDVFKLAKLSNISISKTESEELLKDMKVILDYVGQLQKLDLKNTKPTYQVTGLSNVMRPDEAFDYKITSEDLLKNVPDTQDHYIKVKRVI
ncbi:MAG TPA: Asp-tRNA(Asn)/Glu-tRNA(Gln) amidotransferase subunit GatC [Candidatus Saccharimonadales bacterium]|jgi:aspartyl/glutamyl-tRNA(Asn/Gln) amidotransferase C subunit|nr:Asp-tRNA(Asn)/Glu-tRNA(Gln) amidotransferase subunit GatC [Candidatus Saccharimonadales bacterium]